MCSGIKHEPGDQDQFYHKGINLLHEHVGMNNSRAQNSLKDW
jgi:hypothetical protein